MSVGERDRGPTKQPPRLFSQQAAARRPRSPPTRPHVSVSPIGRREKGTAPAKRAPPSPSPRHGEVSRQQLLLRQGRHLQVRCFHDPRFLLPRSILNFLALDQRTWNPSLFLTLTRMYNYFTVASLQSLLFASFWIRCVLLHRRTVVVFGDLQCVA